MTEFSLTEPRAGHPIAQLADSLATRIRNIRRRRGFTRMLDLDDHMLHDIGVTRGEVAIAAGLPLSQDAAVELRRMSLERRRQMM